MSYDLSKLRGRIIEKYGTLQKFSKVMKWSERTNSLKINSKTEWTQNEIMRASKLLDIEDYKINEYFFTTKVQ